MMLFGHCVVGTAGFIVFLSATSPEHNLFSTSVVMGWLLTMLGVILPDIDHPNSTVGRRCLWLSWPIRLIFGHRGITHSLIAVFAIGFLALKLEASWISWVALGYLLHIFGDYLTPSGVRLFYPLSRTFRAPVIANTGGAGELLLSFLLLLLALLWAYY